jgi:hypothetical protein
VSFAFGTVAWTVLRTVFWIVLGTVLCMVSGTVSGMIVVHLVADAVNYSGPPHTDIDCFE